MSDKTIGCGGCESRWTGLLTCHCSGCHLTFSSVTAFDKHRKYYKCVRPNKTMSQDESGIWHLPGARIAA